MKTLFGKKRSAQSYPPPCTPITATFAQEMLDLEEQVNLHCSMPLVTRLVSLYRKAIEFYEADKNLKHIHYQDRLRLLLSKTNVLLLLKASTLPSAQPHPPHSPKNKQVFELVVERNCEKVIKEHLEGNMDVAKKIQNNLRGQSESLNQRILQRKIAHSPRAFKKFGFDEASTDRESGNSNPLEEFEKELEEILENYIKSKKKLKKAIQLKYQEHFNEANSMHSQKEQLLQELRKSMNLEVQQALLEADSKRLDQVAAAREKLNTRI